MKCCLLPVKSAGLIFRGRGESCCSYQCSLYTNIRVKHGKSGGFGHIVLRRMNTSDKQLESLLYHMLNLVHEAIPKNWRRFEKCEQLFTS